MRIQFYLFHILLWSVERPELKTQAGLKGLTLPTCKWKLDSFCYPPNDIVLTPKETHTSMCNFQSPDAWKRPKNFCATQEALDLHESLQVLKEHYKNIAGIHNAKVLCTSKSKNSLSTNLHFFLAMTKPKKLLE